VLVEGGSGNVGGVGTDAEGEAALRFPGGDGFDEHEAAFEAGVADAADSFVGECGFDGARKANSLRPGGGEFRWGDRRDALDVLPDGRGRGVDEAVKRASAGASRKGSAAMQVSVRLEGLRRRPQRPAMTPPMVAQSNATGAAMRMQMKPSIMKRHRVVSMRPTETHGRKIHFHTLTGLIASARRMVRMPMTIGPRKRKAMVITMVEWPPPQAKWASSRRRMP